MDPDLPDAMLFIGRAADGIFHRDEIGRMGSASSVNNRAGKFRKAAEPVADEGIEETRAFLSDLARSARYSAAPSFGAKPS
jgi:hypothetical protein